eukprot:Rmarinus@m.1179
MAPTVGHDGESSVVDGESREPLAGMSTPPAHGVGTSRTEEMIATKKPMGSTSFLATEVERTRRALFGENNETGLVVDPFDLVVPTPGSSIRGSVSTVKRNELIEEPSLSAKFIPRLATYSGQPDEDLEEFIDAFEHQVKFVLQWTDPRKIRAYLMSLLKEEALAYVRTLSMERIATVRQLLDELRRQFEGISTKEEAWYRLRKCYQRDSTVVQYLNEMRQILRKVNPRMEDYDKNGHFLTGLRPQLRDYVRERACIEKESFHRICSLAAQGERHFRENTEISQLTSQVSHLTKLVERLTTGTANAGATQTSTYTQRPTNALRKPQYRFSADGKPICNNCNEIGHKFFECPLRDTPVPTAATGANATPLGARKAFVGTLDVVRRVKAAQRKLLMVRLWKSESISEIAAVDTGATVTLVAVATLKKFGMLDRVRTLEGVSLTDLTGEFAPLGVAEMDVAGTGLFPFLVVEKLPCKAGFLLGNDFLDDCGCTAIDLERRLLLWPTFSLQIEEVISCGLLHPVMYANLAEGVEAEFADDTKGVLEWPPTDTKNNIDEFTVGLDTDLRDLVNEFSTLFDLSQKTTIRGAQHDITLVDNASPVRSQPYYMNPKKRAFADAEVQRMLREGLIEPSNGEWASPVVLVAKKDEEGRILSDVFRFCVDYRKLNALTIPDVYPITRAETVREVAAGADYLTVVDADAGFHQIKMNPLHKKYTAFIYSGGCFQFTVMPFGLRNAPATFQRCMNSTLGPEILAKFATVFIDDTGVFSKGKEQHLKHLRMVFQKFAENRVKLKIKKCVFAKARVKYLGHWYSTTGIEPLEDKVEAIKEYQAPTNVRQLRAFLGLVGYYRQFIEGFASIASPLRVLTSPREKFVWSSECQRAFEQLKRKLVEAPVLAHPRFDRQFSLTTDASGTGLGAVLAQEGEDGKVHPVAYASRALVPAETRYSATERECLGVMFAVKKFREYVEGGVQPTVVYTDHAALTWLLSLKDPTSRLTRWSVYLMPYTLEIKHRSGVKLPHADGLSRLMVLTLDLTEERSFTERFCQAQEEDEDCRRLRLYMTKQELPDDDKLARAVVMMAPAFCVSSDNVLMYVPGKKKGAQPRWVVPVSLVPQVLDMMHGGEAECAHAGIQRTFEKVSTMFYWKGCYTDVEKWVKACEVCQTIKPVRMMVGGKMEAVVVNRAMQLMALDPVGPLVRSANGNRYVLVFSDYYTKYSIAFPVQDITAETVADIFVHEVMCRLGLPEKLLTDRGMNLRAEVFAALCAKLGVRRGFTTAYHPQGDGQVERFNHTLIKMVTAYISDDHKDWDEHLALVCFAYNTTRHVTTGQEPFYLMHGRDALTPARGMRVTDGERVRGPQGPLPYYVRQMEASLDEVADIVVATVQKEKTRQIRGYDQRRREISFEVGDRVLVEFTVPPAGVPSRKFADRYYGPYRIVAKLSPVTYQVAFVNRKRVSEIIHVKRLRKYNDFDWDKFVTKGVEVIQLFSDDEGEVGGSVRAASDLEDIMGIAVVENECGRSDGKGVDGVTEGNLSVVGEDGEDDGYPVKALVGKRRRGRGVQYLVQWEDESAPPTWTPSAWISDDLIAEYDGERVRPK